jgi:NSS family neurotransmitter:Na+ symporter
VEAQRAQWGSRLGFILAAAGSAVGLGNIWKFPYITGENGGGLFVIIYLICIALVGIPIMVAEIMIGRAAQAQPVVAFERLQGRKTPWMGVGWLGVIAGFVILSYYIVVAGWAMDYTLKSVVNFTKPIHEQAEVAGAQYRATTPTDEMRDMLIERMAERETRADIAQIRAKAKPSAWRAYDLYQAALEEAGIVDNGIEESPRLQAVRSRLMEDEQFAQQITRAEELREEIRIARRAAIDEAAAHYAAMDNVDIHDEAEDVHRRQIIFDKVNAAFGAVATDGWMSAFWAGLFMLITILIVSAGISGGIERACRFLMPTLIILILVMVFYGAFQQGFSEALHFVFWPDPTKLKPSGVLEALGHAFFTLSLGMGAMITYGSYQSTKTQLGSQAVAIAVLDTMIALLACLMLFPIVFSYGQEADQGAGLVFKSMPLAFAEIGAGGMLLAILFFGLLVFAALTSGISLLEVVASYFIDQLGWSRHKAAWIMGGAIFAFGLGSAFAADPDFLMAGWTPSFGKDFFTTVDYLASNWLLPLGGLFIAIYAGWAMPKRLRDAETADLAPPLVMGWLILVRFVAPILVIVVLLQKVGILDADEVFHGLLN